MIEKVTHNETAIFIESGEDEGDAVSIWLSNTSNHKDGFYVASNSCREGAIDDAIVLLEHTIEQLKSVKTKEPK